MNKRGWYGILIVLFVLFAFMQVMVGSEYSWVQSLRCLFTGECEGLLNGVIFQWRVPRFVTSCLVGASLAASGQMCQVLFHNDLASPSVLGITSGAHFMVSLLFLVIGGSVGSLLHYQIAFSFIGAFLVLGILLLVSSWVSNNTILLLLGVMIGIMVSGVVNVFQLQAEPHVLKRFVLWGMGSYSKVRGWDLLILSIGSIAGLVFSFFLTKPMNYLILGEERAALLGVSVKKTRFALIAVVGMLTAFSVAFCGPVGFLGLAVPHISRGVLKTENQKHLMLSNVLCGMVISMVCEFLARGIFTKPLPIGVVTAILGAPVVIYVLLKKRGR